MTRRMIRLQTVPRVGSSWEQTMVLEWAAVQHAPVLKPL